MCSLANQLSETSGVIIGSISIAFSSTFEIKNRNFHIRFSKVMLVFVPTTSVYVIDFQKLVIQFSMLL